MQIFAENLRKADINIASSGDNTIIAAPSQGYIAIDHINLLATSAVAIQFKDGTTNYGGAYAFDTKQAMALDNSTGDQHGVITCLPGNAFVINLGAAIQVSGFIRFRIVGA